MSILGFYLPGPGAILGLAIPTLSDLEKVLTGLFGTCDKVYLPDSLIVSRWFYKPGPGTFMTNLPVDALLIGFILVQPLPLFCDMKYCPLAFRPNAGERSYFCGPGTIIALPMLCLNLFSPHLL